VTKGRFGGSEIRNSQGHKASSRAGSQLLRVQSERLELPAPLGRRITKPLYADAARQATFNGCSDEIWGEERERDRHVDLTRAAFFARGNLFDFRDSARYDLVEPASASGDCADEARATLDPGWTDFIW
jgi:hypothetical protein